MEPLLLPASATHTPAPGVSVFHYPDPSHPTLALAICSCCLLQSWHPSATFLLWPGLFPVALCLAKVQLFNRGRWCSLSPLGSSCSYTASHHSLCSTFRWEYRSWLRGPWVIVGGIATPVSFHTQLLFLLQGVDQCHQGSSSGEDSCYSDF